MMRRRKRDQGKLFYEFRPEDRIQESHLLRRMNVFVTAALADLNAQLEPFYSDIGRPSVDPELMIRMLLIDGVEEDLREELSRGSSTELAALEPVLERLQRRRIRQEEFKVVGEC